jgi:hypothetical protein
VCVHIAQWRRGAKSLVISLVNDHTAYISSHCCMYLRDFYATHSFKKSCLYTYSDCFDKIIKVVKWRNDSLFIKYTPMHWCVHPWPKEYLLVGAVSVSSFVLDWQLKCGALALLSYTRSTLFFLAWLVPSNLVSTHLQGYRHHSPFSSVHSPKCSDSLYVQPLAPVHQIK